MLCRYNIIAFSLAVCCFSQPCCDSLNIRLAGSQDFFAGDFEWLWRRNIRLLCRDYDVVTLESSALFCHARLLITRKHNAFTTLQVIVVWSWSFYASGSLSFQRNVKHTHTFFVKNQHGMDNSKYGLKRWCSHHQLHKEALTFLVITYLIPST